MGKSFKRQVHKRRIQNRKISTETEIELVVETVEIKSKPDSKISSVIEYQPEIVPVVQVSKEVVEEVQEVSSEELAKSVLQAQSKKGAVKKK